MSTPRQSQQWGYGPVCGTLFRTALGSRETYCSDKCKERAKKQKLYDTRRAEGLCPQCGGELKKSSDRRGEYCDCCAEKFHRYYR
ncbi:hypothetical protein CEB3_c13300 [Peptococcaceae bacterium CEB3]|nr:hypothetical protein CEB3_c13300 [Peptococcaceae bacterium CEB3]